MPKPEENITDVFSDMGKTLGAALESLCETLGPMWRELGEQLEEAWGQIYPILRQKYEEAGAPYGPSDEGMWRYFKEEQGFRNAVEVYRETVAWRKALVDFRRQQPLEGKGENQ